MSKHVGILAALILSTAGFCTGRALADEVLPQIWLDYNASHQLSPKVDIFGDAGIRWTTESEGWLRLILRPSVSMPAGRVRLSFGIGNFYTFNDLIENRWELRPYQGAAMTWWSDRFSVEHLLRLEERFDFNTETWNSLNSIRVRYQLRASYRWSAIKAGRSWKATASVEPFLTLTGEQGQQRELVRATIGLTRSFSYERRLEFDASWQQESLIFKPDENVNDIFLRVRWFRHW